MTDWKKRNITNLFFVIKTFQPTWLLFFLVEQMVTLEQRTIDVVNLTPPFFFEIYTG